MEKTTSLHRRTVRTVVLLLGVALVSFALITNFFLLESFRRLERQDAAAHLERLQAAIAQDLAKLASTAADWAVWDDTYAFMAGHDNSYIASNLTAEVFHNLRLNFMAFLGPDGEIVLAKGRDLDSKRFVPVPEPLLTQLGNNRMVSAATLDTRILGLVMLPEHPVLVASHPILTSERTGPLRGHLLVGRFLNKAEIEHYEQLLGIDVTVGTPASTHAQGKLEQGYIIHELNSKSIAAYTAVNDVFGQPATTVGVVGPRRISAVGRVAAGYFIVVLTIMASALAIEFLAFLRRAVFTRLTGISRAVGLIGSEGTLTRLAHNNESDELTIVTVAINGMLDRLEQSQQQIVESEKRYRLIAENTTDTIFVTDLSSRITYVSPSVLNLRGYTAEETLGHGWPEIFDTAFADALHEFLAADADMPQYAGPDKRRRLVLESLVQRKDGSSVWVENTLSWLWGEDGERVGVLLVARDISESKRALDRLKYYSVHDELTGLYNRTFFEAELRRLENSQYYPMTIICADLDGLKLVNDSMGHDQGDLLLRTAANILTQSFPDYGILCRVGGDEFTVIAPHTDAERAAALVKNAKAVLSESNASVGAIPLDISFGVATAATPETALPALYKQADDLMYKDKLHRHAGNRSRIVQSLLAALSERDYIAEGHAQRLSDLCHSMGNRVNLAPAQMADLLLLAQVHDLGKVGIPDAILNKAGPLDKEEIAIMQRHPEIGFRIATSSPDLAPVAHLILRHHEKWDGSGYPLGLKGEDIPIECRILAIIDAFDAMTNDRPYRTAASKETAIAEIKRHAGTQFDPYLAGLFIDVMKDEP